MKEYPSPDTKTSWMLAVSYLTMLDGAVSAIFIRRHGLEMEGNPLVRFVYEQADIPGVLLFKLLSILFYWIVNTEYAWRTGHEFPLWPEKLLCAVLLPVCAVGAYMAIA